MTDIRRHGFESDAQWREHLAEIEEMEKESVEARERSALAELAGLRSELDALRIAVHAHLRRRRRQWRIAGAGLALLLVAAAAGLKSSMR